MSFVPHHVLVQLLHAYGYPALAILIALECLGLPLPGETLLIGAVLYAVHTRNLDTSLIVLCASLGAFVGQLGGYVIGYTLGYRLLRTHGARIGLTASRLSLGRILFRRHGVKVVIASRFVALLRQLGGAARRRDAHAMAAFSGGECRRQRAVGRRVRLGAEALGDTLKQPRRSGRDRAWRRRGRRHCRRHAVRPSSRKTADGPRGPARAGLA